MQKPKKYDIIVYIDFFAGFFVNTGRSEDCMDLDMVKYLSGLAKLGFSEEGYAKMAEDMTDIIAIMDTVKEIDISYDPLKDNHNVYLKDLRKDEAAPSLPTEKILRNAVNSENSFVVPKVVE